LLTCDKAVSEQGVRLHIRKATLRHWRREFARHLREQGIAANATERAVRGQGKGHKLDGIYRPMTEDGRYSTHMENKTRAVAAELMNGGLRVEAGKAKLITTRNEIERGWEAIGEILVTEGHGDLAEQARRFAQRMSPPQTEREQIAAELLEHAREVRAPQKPPPSR